MFRTFLLAAFLLLPGCARGRSCCPPRAPCCAPSASVAVDTTRSIQYQAARTAWTDEITAATTWLGNCLFEASSESVPEEQQERLRDECKKKFDARMKANDAAFELRKAEIGN